MRSKFLALLLLAPLALPSAAQSASDTFHRAYYLEHAEGDAEGALALYRKVADDRKADGALRERASRAADGVAEDLASADLARLVPAETVVYIELARPGAQLEDLFGQLGLLGEAGDLAAGRFGISPALLQGALGLRGAAVALTEIDPGGEPRGVLILHPGELAVVRGLLETAIPAAGMLAEPIGGHPVWDIQGEAIVCLTERLAIAGRDRASIAAVVERLGNPGRPSLADDPGLARARAGGGGGALLSFYVNAEPVKPMLMGMLQQQAADEPAAAIALAMLDPASLRGLGGSIAVVEDGLALDFALELQEGHRNRLFDLVRKPTMSRAALDLVPAGSALFVASAVNPAGPQTPLMRDSTGRPIVTLMDIGRELFGNLVDFAFFATGEVAGPIPDFAVCMRVNDVERSRAIWGLALEMASAGAAPKTVEFDGAEAQRYIVQGFPVHLAWSGDRVFLSPFETAIERALQGPGLTSDEAFGGAFAKLDGPTEIGAAHLGRLAKLAATYMPEQVGPYVDLLRDTTVLGASFHTDTRLGATLRVRNLPDVGPLVNGLLQQQKQPRVAEVGIQRALDEDDGELVRALAASYAEEADPKAVNNMAWAMLTEARHAERYDDVALQLSERSNARTNYESWYYLDTLALARFRAGDIEGAIQAQEQAVERGGSESPEVMAQLETYRAAAGTKGVARSASSAKAAATTKAAALPSDPQELLALFDKVQASDAARARAVGMRLLEVDATPGQLNDLAWVLLTEERYGKRYPELALALSQASNDRTDNGNWALLDTLAHAYFALGRVADAVATEEEAISIALETNDNRVGEAQATLKRFKAALGN